MSTVCWSHNDRGAEGGNKREQASSRSPSSSHMSRTRRKSWLVYLAQREEKRLTAAALSAGAGTRPAPVDSRDAADVPVLLLPPRTQGPAHQ
jgi:hypothetical protein